MQSLIVIAVRISGLLPPYTLTEESFVVKLFMVVYLLSDRIKSIHCNITLSLLPLPDNNTVFCCAMCR